MCDDHRKTHDDYRRTKETPENRQRRLDAQRTRDQCRQTEETPEKDWKLTLCLRAVYPHGTYMLTREGSPLQCFTHIHLVIIFA